MHLNMSTKRFTWRAWYLHSMDFFLKKGGTLEQGAITYSANEFFSWGNVGMCSGDPKVHQGTNQVKSWGGAGVPPSAPWLQGVHQRHYIMCLWQSPVLDWRCGRFKEGFPVASWALILITSPGHAMIVYLIHCQRLAGLHVVVYMSKKALIWR